MMWWEGLYTDYNDVVGGGYTRTTMMWWVRVYTGYNDMVGEGYTQSTMMWWEGAIHGLQ